MGIPVKLQAFEGPLDLLLHLIDKNKVNIYDIPIVEITRQYLDYIQQMEKEDLNIMSEFLVMAATLIDIKSKMLLPREVNEEGDETDPRQELVEKLIEYKMYKYMAYELKDRQIDAEKVLFKEPTIPKEIEEYSEPVNVEELLDGLSLARLHSIFKSIIRKQENKIDPIRSRFGKIEKEEVSLSEKIEYIKVFATENNKFSFRKLLEEQCSKMEVIVTFLAILELMKTGLIAISQEKIFDDILIITT
ncbi:segregation and condensation protein A [Candidatus Galacturonibacter soehngenii]|uniref:Segregation and condensation protein A n=1 Tax=Candidatus Galacturonatibacter soehngenii TaxID=2307010 RepID=A0A7V7QMW8_9FIRM|nr:segregation/condensation protein A [Candidatus Galacturonibacter soehngenii]KAB1440086.1 segregation/condensation protein A [Candidatus Galacturonibacter soehngenii]